MDSMMKKSIAIAALTLAVFTANAFADQGCGNPKTEYDQTYCTAKLFVESDTELNQVYTELSKMVDPTAKTSLLQAQRQWIKFRDSTCSSQGTIDVQCNFEVNRDRAQYLQDRLRECKT